MGSSLPNYDAKDWKGQTKKRQKKKRKTQGQTASDMVRAQKKKEKEKKRTIYIMHEQNNHMMHALMH